MVKMFNWFKKKEAPKPAPQEEERAFDRFLELQQAQDNSDIPAQKLTKEQQDELLKLSFPLGKVQMKDAQSGKYAMDADFSYQDLQGMITDAGRADDRIFTFYAKHGFIGWQLCAIISQNWLVANACSIPAEDAVRPLWRNIIKKKSELETDEEKEEEATELTDLTLKKYHLGVSYALLCIDGIDYSQPFNLDSVRPGSFKGISIIDPVWLAPQWNSGALNNPGSPNFYEPDYYQVNGLGRVHRSHFIKLIHEEVPDILKPSYYFGGLGVAQMIYERVYAAERTANEAPLLALTKRLLVVPTNLKTLAAKPEVAWKLIKMLVFGRDNQGVYFTEEGEKNQVHQVDTSLSDLDAVIMTQYQLVASISRIPAHKLLKTDPKGLNNNGLYTIKDYTQELQSLQEKAARPLIERVNAVTLRSDLYELKEVEQVITEFNPIDMPTEKEKAEVESLQAQTAAQYVAAGILSPEEVRKALRSERGGRFADIDEELPADEIPDDLELPEEEPALDEWEESKHPRKDNGQFGTGSGEKKTVSKKEAQNLSKQEAEALYKSDWIEAVRNAIAQLPKSSNGRPYLQNGETVVDVPERLAGEVKKEILNNNKTREEKIGAVWAIHHLPELFSAAVAETPEPDVHRRKNVKSVIRYNIPFPLMIEDKNYAFNTKFTVREFEDGRKVLAPELLEINKGRDLGLYALKTKKEDPET